jgi:hypothetical protein
MSRGTYLNEDELDHVGWSRLWKVARVSCCLFRGVLQWSMSRLSGKGESQGEAKARRTGSITHHFEVVCGGGDRAEHPRHSVDST